MKRNCNGCKALKESSRFNPVCTLGHKITKSKEMWGIPLEYKPCEECEKPKTNTELLRLQGYSI